MIAVAAFLLGVVVGCRLARNRNPGHIQALQDVYYGLPKRPVGGPGAS